LVADSAQCATTPTSLAWRGPGSAAGATKTLALSSFHKTGIFTQSVNKDKTVKKYGDEVTEANPQRAARDYIRTIDPFEFSRMLGMMRTDLNATGRFSHFEVEAFIETLTGVRHGFNGLV
jgi:hypothetical protein